MTIRKQRERKPNCINTSISILSSKCITQTTKPQIKFSSFRSWAQPLGSPRGERWESVCSHPGLCKPLFPLPSRRPSSAPVCQAPSFLVQAFRFCQDHLLRMTQIWPYAHPRLVAVFRVPKCVDSPHRTLFLVFISRWVCSFRHLLTCELEIKSVFLKDEKVVSHFLPAHMKGLPTEPSPHRTRKMSMPWVLKTPPLGERTASPLCTLAEQCEL